MRYLEIAEAAAREAGAMLMENLSGEKGLKFKGEINLVTRMDFESERMITGLLTEAFPDYNIVSEEGFFKEHPSDFTWYIDPLDGTTNYAHGIPWFAVSLGLQKNGKSVFGLVYCPPTGDLYWASVGHGAFHNGAPMRVSPENELSRSLLVTGFPYDIHTNYEEILRDFKNMVTSCQAIRRFGVASLDLCLIARGLFDGFWERGLKPWDTAAGILIVSEAGGLVTDFNGEEFDVGGKNILASNGKIHHRLIEILNRPAV